MNQQIMKGTGIQSIENAFRVLEEMKKSNHPLTLTELSNKVGVSKNNLKKYLVSFVNIGVLTFEVEGKTYDLGPKLIDLGLNALNRIDIYSIIDPYMLDIKNKFNQSSVLAIWTKDGPMITKYQGSGRSINVEIEIGYSPPLLGSSVGKCFAAYLPEHYTKDIMDEEIDIHGLDKETIFKEIRQVKEDGFSSRDRYFDDLPGSNSLACPIFDHSNHIVAVIGIIGFVDYLNTDLIPHIKKIAKQISSQLAY